MIYIGIDPGEGKGKEGAVATLHPQINFINIVDCPQTEEAMAEIIMQYDIRNLCVTLEKAPKKMSILDKNGKRRILHPTVLYGNFKAWKGILATLNSCYGLRYDIVHPRTWQTILDGNKKLSTKERAMEMACRLYPEAKELLIGPRGAKKFGRSDALIILEYGRRKIWL